MRGEYRVQGCLFWVYRTGTHLKDLSFTVAPGQTIALWGKRGSGKTTLVK
jgi:ABC-type bacteriocin/lantibiotic exporter with double-glycine peptidase domain